MKKILCLILCLIMAAAVLCACSENDTAKPEEAGQLFTVRDELKRDTMTALFRNTSTGGTKEVEMTKGEDGEDCSVFTCNADPEEFDRVTLTSGEESTPELSFNSYVPGWRLDKRRFMPLDNGEKPEYKRVSFEYQNRTKDVLIWTPDDYDANSSEKYSVIYMSDGHNLFDPAATSTGSWAVAESVRAMMAQGGQGCIIVGVENMDGWRDDELTPDIGEVTSEDYKDGHGEYYADFVVDTVMPYVNENYNVYTDREHTHVCGSSSGGLECFYIAMEHPDKFASVGALSPAFILFTDETWTEYFKDKDYSKNAPFIYLYCGNAAADSLEQTLYIGTVAMPDTLKKIGYPEDKVVMKLYDEGLHNEMYWRAVFPDYLKYAFAK